MPGLTSLSAFQKSPQSPQSASVGCLLGHICLDTPHPWFSLRGRGWKHRLADTGTTVWVLSLAYLALGSFVLLTGFPAVKVT